MTVELPVKIKVEGAAEAKRDLGGLTGIWNNQKAAITGLIGAFSGVAVVSKTVDLLKDMQKEAQANRTAVTLLTVQMGYYSKALSDQADEMERKLFIDNREVLQAEQALLVYTREEEAIRKLIPGIADLSRVKGIDMASAANMVGVALKKSNEATVGQTISIRGLGISFKSTGDEAKNVIEIQKELEKSVGGASKAVADSMDGWTKLTKKLEQLKDKIGKDIFGGSKEEEERDAIEEKRRQSLQTEEEFDKRAWPAIKKRLDALKIEVKAYDDRQKAIKESADAKSKASKEQEDTEAAAEKSMEEATKNKIKYEAELDAVIASGTEQAAQNEREKKELISQIQFEADTAYLDEEDRKQAELTLKFREQFAMLSGDFKAQAKLNQVYQANKRKIEKEYADKSFKEQQEITDKEKQESEERIQQARREKDEKTRFSFYYTHSSLNLMMQLAEATESSRKTRQGIAMAEAVVQGAQGIMGIIANTDQYVKIFSPVGAPIAMGIQEALITGVTAAQIGLIASGKKMAYGGVVSGGTPGQDSVPALLMPGEIVYNPSHPNPALASMINNNTTSSMSTTNVQMGNIIIQGSMDSTTARKVQNITEKALISALRKAQVGGKVTASGLKIRN